MLWRGWRRSWEWGSGRRRGRWRDDKSNGRQPLLVTLLTLAVILVGLALIVAVNFLVFLPLVWIIAKLDGLRKTAEDAGQTGVCDGVQPPHDPKPVASDDSPCALNRPPLRHRTASVAMLVLDAAGLLLITFCTTFGVARFRRIFDDLLEGHRLPPLTNAFLSVPGTAYVLLFSGLIVALVLKELYVANKTRTLVVNVAIFVASALFFMAFVVAMATPMFSIIGTVVE